MTELPLTCSPINSRKFAIKDGTCFSRQDLLDLSKAYNLKTTTSMTKSQLLSKLKRFMNDKCVNESCWISQENLNDRQLASRLNQSLRPIQPVEWSKNPETWLTNYDIEAVMNQYEKVYRNLRFLGVFPIDFAKTFRFSTKCIGESLCDFDIHKHVLNLKKTQFAFIVNLDRHDQSGSHWVAVYCNLDKSSINYGIFYYDSVAPSKKPPVEISNFMDKVSSQVKNDNFRKVVNHITHQKFNNECGMFSMVFLTQCFKNQIKVEEIFSRMKGDVEMNRLRDVLFTKPISKMI